MFLRARLSHVIGKGLLEVLKVLFLVVVPFSMMDGMVGNTALYTRLAECLIKHTDYFFGEPESPSPATQRHTHGLPDQIATAVEEKEEESQQVRGDGSTSSTLDRSELGINAPSNGDSRGGKG